MAQKPSGTLTKWEKQWRERIEAWRSSGQRQSEFCRAQGLAVSSFSHWKLELARREQLGAGEVGALEPLQAGRSEAPEGQSLGWQQVPWPVTPPTGAVPGPAGAGLEVVLPSGCLIRLGPWFEAESLKRLLGVLEGVPC
jgi:hypothetical protein